MFVDSATVPVGSVAPGFSLTDQHGDTVSLDGLRGKKVVLVFLRGFL